MARQPRTVSNRPQGNPNTTGGPGSLVTFVRAEVRAHQEEYDKISDCLEGEVVIKKKGKTYLPAPDPLNTSSQNVERYNQYVVRAQFYNATRRTLNGLLGEVFAVDPVITVPEELELVVEDANGEGVTAIQQAVAATYNVLAYSRAGVLVDFPARPVDPATGEPKAVSVAEVEEGDTHPLIFVYSGENIINWRTMRRARKTVLTLVVLVEYVDQEADTIGFEIKTEKQFRVLRLDNKGEYYVQLWRENSAAPFATFFPRDAEGKRLNFIPFKFIGATKNTPEVEPPLFYDLASLNVGHYRNSADYEESSFTVGQPTYCFGGLTKQWVKEVIGTRVEVGSRAAIALPEKGTAELLQPNPNVMPKELMEMKERQMVALGAKLVENKNVQETATKVTMDQRTENSILATAANNVSTAFTWAFTVAAQFMGVKLPEKDADDALEFTLNTEFAIAKLAPEEQAQVIASWQAGLISFSEARYLLKKSALTSQKDEDAKKEIEEEQKAKEESEIRKIEAKKPPVAGGTTNPSGATKGV